MTLILEFDRVGLSVFQNHILFMKLVAQKMSF